MRYIYFYGKLCGWCNDAKPIIERLKEEHDVTEYDIKSRLGLAQSMLFGVIETPTLIRIGPDGFVLNRYYGNPKRWDLGAMIHGK